MLIILYLFEHFKLNFEIIKLTLNIINIIYEI